MFTFIKSLPLWRLVGAALGTVLLGLWISMGFELWKLAIPVGLILAFLFEPRWGARS